MKRIAIAFCLLLLLAMPVNAQEYDYVAGAGGAGGCGVTDQQTTQATLLFLGYSADYAYTATNFTAAGNATIKTVSVNLTKTGSPTAAITVALCTDGTGKPGTCTNADATIDGSTLTGSYVYYDVKFAAGYALTASTVYYVRLYTTAANSSNYYRWGRNDAVTGYLTQNSADGASWTTGDSSAQGNFKLSTCP